MDVRGGHTDNSLSRYYDLIRAAMDYMRAETDDSAINYFQPQWDLPELSASMEDFFATSSISGYSMGEYKSHPLWFLDLTGNPGTRTVKTFGSLMIAARALHHTAVTGEPVMLLTPSSANKAVALRDVVLRAYQTGISSPDNLRVVTVVPSSGLHKVWGSALASEPRFAAANPIGVYDGPRRENVKLFTSSAADTVSSKVLEETGFRIWFTLDPRNYMAADVVRAFFEEEELPPGEKTRWHAHAVSSAYGLLGHDLGRRFPARDRSPRKGSVHYLLVQHLETPDLVVNFHPNTADDYILPKYELDPSSGIYFQKRPHDPHFPTSCYSPAERLEPTFYTHGPQTTSQVRELFRRQGGDGIVVSLHECLNRYQEVRQLLRRAKFTRLPEDPRMLREWAIVMSVAGALTAIDRGLIPDNDELVLHGSGAYSEGEFEALNRSWAQSIYSADDVAAMLWKAART